MMRFCAGLAVALGLLMPAAAQMAPEVTREQTASGLTVFRASMPRAQMQSLRVVWQDNSARSPAFPAGITTVAPYLMGRGPMGEALGEITEALRDYQASFSFNLETEQASLAIFSPPEHFSATLAVLKRFLDNPALPEKRLQTLKREARLSSLQSLRRPEQVATQLRIRSLASLAALREHLLTDPAKLDGVTREHVQQWRGIALARNKVQIVTAGPLPANVVALAVDQLLNGTPLEAAHEAVALPAMREHAPRMVALEMPAPQTIIQAFGPTGVGRSLDDLPANVALQRMGGAQGRLHAVLRDRLGATYGVEMRNVDYLRGIQTVLISSAVEHGKAVEAVAAIREEYAKWWRDGMTAAEFDAVKSSMLGSRQSARIAPAAVVATLSRALSNNLAPDSYFTMYDAALQALTREQVNAYIRQRYPETLGFVVVAPSAEGLAADCVIKSLEEAGRCGL